MVGDARETVDELAAALGGWKADATWTDKGRVEFAKWNTMLDGFQKPTNAPGADLCAGRRAW